jgi:6-bladed beta-propeller protein
MHPSWRSAIVCLLCACTAEPGTRGRTERHVVGDTTIVRTLEGSVWGDSVTLTEELSIGALNGPPEYEFGQVQDVAVDQNGGIYLFDGQVPALRYFDSTGRYVRTLGARGGGPGEYQDASLGVVIRHQDGKVVMRDPRNARLNIYAPDGSPLPPVLVTSGLFTAQATTLDTADHLYLRIMTGRPERNKPWPIALLHLDDEGNIVDTLVPPVVAGEPLEIGGTLFARAKHWAYSPLRGFVVALSDQYRVEHFRADGTVLRIERDVPPVAVHPEEKAELEAMNDWRYRTQGQFMTTDKPTVPDVKGMIRGLVVAEDGRIWVRRYAPAEKGEPVSGPTQQGQEPPPPQSWREPNVYDVFEPDGTFLGTVRLPPRMGLSVMRGDRIWGVREGPDGESQVARFRIVPNR